MTGNTKATLCGAMAAKWKKSEATDVVHVVVALYMYGVVTQYALFIDDCVVRRKSYWNKYEPNNCCKGENCMHMWAGKNGKWNDNNCATKMNFACKVSAIFQMSFLT